MSELFATLTRLLDNFVSHSTDSACHACGDFKPSWLRNVSLWVAGDGVLMIRP